MDLSEIQEAIGQDVINQIEEISGDEINDVSESTYQKEEGTENAITHSSLQIAPQVLYDTNEFDPLTFIQLGDRIYIDCKYGKLVGRVYYRSLEFMTIRPEDGSYMLYAFKLTQTEEEELYDEDDEVKELFIIEKRMYGAFVKQHNFRVGDHIDTILTEFNKAGTKDKSYIINKIDFNNDLIILKNPQEPAIDLIIPFDFIGIPRDMDFQMISISKIVNESDQNIEGYEIEADTQDQSVNENQEQESEQESEKDEIEILGYIEVARPKVFIEAEEHEQRIPDSIQKIDAFNDFINMTPVALQKDPNTLRSLRILIETLHYLKQATIKYEIDDNIAEDTQTISIETIEQLMNIAHVPLGRPVLNVGKRLYRLKDDIHSDDLEKDEDEDEDKDDMYYNDKIEPIFFLNEFDEIKNISNRRVSSKVSGEKTAMIQEWADQQIYYKKFELPWKKIGERDEYQWHAIKDTDFFRLVPPNRKIPKDSDEEDWEEDTIPGYHASHNIKKDIEPVYGDDLLYGVERALTGSYYKNRENGRNSLIESEGSTLISYVLYPLRIANYLGMIRSKFLARDSGRSQLKPKLLSEILNLLKNPSEDGTSNNIRLIRNIDPIDGVVELTDYIRESPIHALGLGDTIPYLEQYGLEQFELTEDMKDDLVERIESYQKRILSTIAAFRQSIELNPSKPSEESQFIPSLTIFEKIRAETLIRLALNDYTFYHNKMKTSDVGMIHYLLQIYPVFFQVLIGSNAEFIAKERMIAMNSIYLEECVIKKIIENNKKNSSYRPRPNNCRHVSDLVTVRKIYDDTERFQALIKVFKYFQGMRSENWINCNVCHDHLICIHERLQIQAFLHPNEKSVIWKKLLLQFSGEQFQGRFICRNCGQAIKDLEFDNNIEFDDNGKPKSGNAVLDDSDLELEMKLSELGPNLENEDPVKKNLTETQTSIHMIVRELTESMGIALDDASYLQIISNVENKFVKLIMDKSIYLKQIALCAAYTIVEIQSKIPSYDMRFKMKTSEEASLQGYPLNRDISETKMVKYVGSVIYSISKTVEPWSAIIALKERVGQSESTILNYIHGNLLMPYLKKIVPEYKVDDALTKKRRYLIIQSEKGNISYTREDSVSPLFLPEMIIIKPEDAAKEQILPEVAQYTGKKGETAIVRLWIRQAHAISRGSAHLVRNLPIVEITCCKSNVKQPSQFWLNQQILPPLLDRKLTPNYQGDLHVTQFKPRDSTLDIVPADSNLNYLIFLKYCFQGDRYGYPHEVGFTNQCIWCGFTFPTHPKLLQNRKSVQDDKKEEYDEILDGKTALDSADVKIDDESFIKLLDRVHTLNIFTVVFHDRIPDFVNIMNIMIDMTISPYNAPLIPWNAVMTETRDNFVKLMDNKEALSINLINIGQQLTSLSEFALKLKDDFYRKIKNVKGVDTAIQNITALSWNNFCDVLLSYLIVPIQQILTKYNTASIFVPYEYNLSDDHFKDIMKKLEENMWITKKMVSEFDSIKSIEFTKYKLSYFLKQLVAVYQLKHLINIDYIPGREDTMIYIKEIFLLGPFYNLLSPEIIENGIYTEAEYKQHSSTANRNNMKLIIPLLNQYMNQSLSYNDKEIKDMIEKRDEKERVNVVAEFDKMSQEEKAVELMNKRLGIGKWAVGGSKLIYAYDKDYYDLERQKRIDAGIIEFPGSSDGIFDPSMDMGYVDESYERDNGYDHDEQNNENDEN